jgi:hypothetical protein
MPQRGSPPSSNPVSPPTTPRHDIFIPSEAWRALLIKVKEFRQSLRRWRCYLKWYRLLKQVPLFLSYRWRRLTLKVLKLMSYFIVNNCVGIQSPVYSRLVSDLED